MLFYLQFCYTLRKFTKCSNLLESASVSRTKFTEVGLVRNKISDCSFLKVRIILYKMQKKKNCFNVVPPFKIVHKLVKVKTHIMPRIYTLYNNFALGVFQQPKGWTPDPETGILSPLRPNKMSFRICCSS